MGFIVDIMLTLIILGVIIFFHELGHFLAAKKLGIVVERFSIGFGPKLIGFVRGGTEYRISWLPFLGGYVKMLGENPGERSDGEADEEEVVPTEGRFDLAPAWHRAIVAVSGPVMNIAFAIIMFTAAFMFGLPAEPDSTITYVAPDSPASEAGIEPGDRIVSIDGYKIRTWNDIVENVITRPGDKLSITISRNGSEKVVHAAPVQKEVPIISISLNLQNELDNKDISIDLRQELGLNEILLSIDAVVVVEEAGSRWLIADGDSKYTIKKEDNGLGVYRGTDTEDMELAFNIALDLRNESALQSDLNNNIVPESLVSKFEAVDMKLSQNAAVAVEEADSEWLVTDKTHGKGILKWLMPSKDKRYHVRRQNGELIVYYETGFGMLGVGQSPTATIRELESGSTAAKAGLRLGDSIEAVNGNKISYDDEFVGALRGISGESVALTVSRDDGTTEIPIPLEYDEYGRLVSFKGLSFEGVVRRNPVSAFMKAVPETMYMGRKIFQFLKKMIFGEVSPKFIAGPLGIVQIAMIMIQAGFAEALQFIGMISVNLGIVNLLPLFITDGAMLVFLAFEGLRRKPLAHKKQLLIQQVGVGFIMLLFLLVTYNDIVRLVMGI